MRLPVLALTALLLTSCGGDDDPKTAPTPTIDRYRVYVQLLDQTAAFAPYITRDEAAAQATRLCAFDAEAWAPYLKQTTGRISTVADRAIDARAFVGTYCSERIPVLEAGVSAAS